MEKECISCIENFTSETSNLFRRKIIILYYWNRNFKLNSFNLIRCSFICNVNVVGSIQIYRFHFISSISLYPDLYVLQTFNFSSVCIIDRASIPCLISSQVKVNFVLPVYLFKLLNKTDESSDTNISWYD